MLEITKSLDTPEVGTISIFTYQKHIDSMLNNCICRVCDTGKVEDFDQFIIKFQTPIITLFNLTVSIQK